MPSSFTEQEVQNLTDATDALLTALGANGYTVHRAIADRTAPVRDALHKLTHCNVRAICGECDLTNSDSHASALLLAAQNDWCSFCYDTLSHREECNKIHPPLRAS